ncbi:MULTISPECIES: tyrosine-type recombinase/integrase [Saccharothrix]|uniref:tyrosine-type recombinase/integrase n=1 Tax=Saccharothrix TaxID=2071 RepID=UPI0009394101|nr:site-specific integrase [Saccharothrix sp. CB00851]OKI33418.1 integrase [Saccharothrix sp. CB00851]
MATQDTSAERRRRGSVRQRGNSLQVRVFAGVDPVTGKDVYLSESVKGTTKAAHKQADKVMTRLLAEVDQQRSTSTTVTFSHAIDEWLKNVELEDNTRDGYVGYIERTIRPALGKVQVRKLSARALESLYSELRRCRIRCDGRPFIERHKAEGEHDCVKAKCKPHKCNPMAASSVRQIHAIISGVLNAAVRWEWISHSPAKVAQKPKQKPPQPDPPSPADAARLVEAAFEMDDDWGTLVWLVMTTGVRRGEVCALRWSHVDLEEGTIEIRRSYTLRRGVGKEKDTKTHQMRRIALDNETLVLLMEHRQRCRARLAELGIELTPDMYVFLGVRKADPTVPYSPHAVSSRYKDMAERLKIDTHLHALRHYSATELLTAGVDLRTVAGRLGHGGGGATTLRVYAAWVAASDRKAAEILGSRMPKRKRAESAD